MNRQQRQRFWNLTSGLVLTSSGVAVAAWAALWPIALPGQRLPGQLPESSTAGSPPGSQHSETDAQWPHLLADRRLQGWPALPAAPHQPLPQPQATATPQPAPPPRPAEDLLGIELAGTVIEAGHSFAIVQDRFGTTDLKPVGGLLQLEPAGMRVDAVAADSAIISLAGTTHRLTLPFPAQTNSSQLIESQPMGSQAVETSATSNLPAGMPAAGSAEAEAAPLTPLEAELDWLNGEPAEAAVPADEAGMMNVPPMGAQP